MAPTWYNVADMDTGEPQASRTSAEWLSIREAAEQVGKSTKTIRRWRADGKIASQMQEGPHGSQWFVRMSDVHGLASPVYEEVEETSAALRVIDEAFKSLQTQHAELVVKLTEEIERRADEVERRATAEAKVEYLEAELEQLTAAVEPPKPAWDFDEEVSGSFGELREGAKPWWRRFRWK